MKNNKLHIYLISEDIINKNDWCVDMYFKAIIKHNGVPYDNMFYLKKIIETNDKLLNEKI